MDDRLLLERYRDGNRDFNWADLSGANLAGASLPQINLCAAKLVGTNLRGADLSGANLYKANLTGADLTGANLAQANLRKANLQNAYLDHVNLTGTNLKGAIMPDGSIHLFSEEPPAPSDVDIDGGSEADGRGEIAPPAEPTPPIASESTSESTVDLVSARSLTTSLVILGLGYGCFGLILGLQGAPLGSWLLVGLTVWMGLIEEGWLWFVPIASAVSVILAVGVSAASLIFALPASILVWGALWMVGSILGWRSQTLIRNGLWFAGWVFILMHLAPWMIFGGDAFSGGGIVLNLKALHLAILLIAGMAAVGRGSLALLQLQEQRYRRSQILQRLGLAAAVGLISGYAITFAWG